MKQLKMWQYLLLILTVLFVSLSLITACAADDDDDDDDNDDATTYDCDGDPTSLEEDVNPFLGNGDCDAWLNCEEFAFDGGDCKAGNGGPECMMAGEVLTPIKDLTGLYGGMIEGETSYVDFDNMTVYTMDNDNATLCTAESISEDEKNDVVCVTAGDSLVGAGMGQDRANVALGPIDVLNPLCDNATVQ